MVPRHIHPQQQRLRQRVHVQIHQLHPIPQLAVFHNFAAAQTDDAPQPLGIAVVVQGHGIGAGEGSGRNAVAQDERAAVDDVRAGGIAAGAGVATP